jgi:hypothetical protein
LALVVASAIGVLTGSLRSSSSARGISTASPVWALSLSGSGPCFEPEEGGHG